MIPAVLGAVLATAGCATMANGAVQRIPVTSDPPGALENGRLSQAGQVILRVPVWAGAS